MKRKLIIASLAVAAALSATAQRGIDHPMTRAVIEAYSKQLAEDPADYETWLRRAQEYYQHNEYMRALSDTDNALKNIPAQNTEERRDAYMLRAGIYERLGRLSTALDELNQVVSISPDYFAGIYQRGNIETELGMYDLAKADFRRLQRMNPRSADALIGLARIAVKENNIGLANEMLDQAVQLDPANPDYYVRRASVRRTMGNSAGAVEDLILALSTDSRSTRATQALVDYAKTDYTAVITGLTTAIRQAPQVAMFVYLRASLEQSHYAYRAALDDYTALLDRQLSSHHGIYSSMAQCRFALGQYTEALDDINRAISANQNVASYYVLKSQILRAAGRVDEAFDTALKASVVNPGGTVALVEMALCREGQKKWSEAADLYGEATMTDPSSPATWLLRATVLRNHLNQPVAAQGFCEHVLDMDGFDLDNPRSLRGFALLELDRKAEALAWIGSVLDGTVTDTALTHYIAACLYAQAGDNDAALASAEQALKAGYANWYDWNDNTDAPVNVAPLRNDLRFLNLLNRYKHIF